MDGKGNNAATEKSAPNWKQEIAKVVWNGGSSSDAWFMASSVQVAQVLLTLPSSFAHLGLGSGVAFQLAYGFMGCWSSYMIVWLYADYRHKKETIENVDFKDHNIQFFEIVDDLLGRFWKAAALCFSVILMFMTCTIQLIASGSIAYYLNDKLDKRTWTMILGTGGLISALIPTAKNYRICSFTGIIMTTYTAWYMTIASIIHGQQQDVTHTGPVNYINYYSSAANIFYAFGGHALTVEIMHPMKNPRKFKRVYVYAVLYILTLTIPSATSVYWAYGDKMLNISMGLAVLPKSVYRDAALVLMLMHQLIEFSMLSMPINFLWEKLIGTHHQTSYLHRSASRLPLILAMWFVALMIPFCGAINSLVGALVTSMIVYILPCTAHMMYYRNAFARQSAIEKLPFWMPTWTGVYCINLAVVLWVTIVPIILGSWSSIVHFQEQVHEFGIFTKCYQCESYKSH